jgi:hypothetical protein
MSRLPGRHLYFLDDHLLGDRRFGALFEGMRARPLFQERQPWIRFFRKSYRRAAEAA